MTKPSVTFRICMLSAACCALLCITSAAHAFADKGHQVIALVARANLKPVAIKEVDRLLALDTTALPMRDGGKTSDSFDRQATWADYYRDTQRGPGVSVESIHSYHWHFVDIELRGGSLETACYGFPQLERGVLASRGVDPDCIVNKIEQFAAELASEAVPDEEKVLALKYLMHFVGDIHQPLHTTDDMDKGGNAKQATVPGAIVPRSLHSHWDSTFVDMVGLAVGAPRGDPRSVSAALRAPTAFEKESWLGKPLPRRWALESYSLGQARVYGALPQPQVTGAKALYVLDDKYVAQATQLVALQLNRAGHRLAAILNDALAP
jgi:hypothetical protein